MSLYRLDAIAPNGGATAPVRDATGRDFLSPSAQLARRWAREHARLAQCSVIITRIGRYGAMRRTAVVEPSGQVRRLPR